MCCDYITYVVPTLAAVTTLFLFIVIKYPITFMISHSMPVSAVLEWNPVKSVRTPFYVNMHQAILKKPDLSTC